LHSKNFILQKLSPFRNYKKVITTDQSTKDIVNGIIDTHYKWDSEYDKISQYFVGADVEETAKNVWEFLKNNVPYYIESSEHQTLRSPAAIISMPGDCKSYSLAINGIFSSLARKGIMNVPIAYRFASYKEGVKEPGHVFSVLYPGTKNEIWVDPVLDRFDDKSKQPTFYKDKKVKMSLIALSGIENNYSAKAKFNEMSAYRDQLVRDRDMLLNSGKIKSGGSKELEYKVAINKVTKALQDMPSISGFNDFLSKVTKNVTSASKTATDLANPVGLAFDAVSTLVNLFANKPNPNDWKGWDASDVRIKAPKGTNAINWIINDGDSVQNEALNLVRYVQANGTKNILGFSTWFNRDITIEDLADKLSRGGFSQEARDLVAASKPKPQDILNLGDKKQAGMNIALTLGLVAGAFFLIKSFAKK
jgi:hypothetical protein